jgi:F-type H+-transporting ATPase subunit delta
MAGSRASTRYAAALLGVAEERNELGEISKDTDFLAGLIAGVPEFALFLRSPVVSAERKKKAIREIIAGRTGATAGAFVMLLVAKGRESLLPEIIREFNRLKDERLGIVTVKARSAAEFTQDQRRRLGERIGAATGKKVRLEIERDESLIGGFTVQYEDTVWDASVRRQLELLRDRLAAGA